MEKFSENRRRLFAYGAMAVATAALIAMWNMMFPSTIVSTNTVPNETAGQNHSRFTPVSPAENIIDSLQAAGHAIPQWVADGNARDAMLRRATDGITGAAREIFGIELEKSKIKDQKSK